MSDQERADLLAAGEKRLAFLGRAMEEAIRDKDLSLARVYRCKYDGAVKMLERLGLISWEESKSITDALWRRFRATRDPEEAP